MSTTSIYPAGQCTDWCATHFPWINEAGNLGNAMEWAAKWQELGYPIGKTPVPDNSVACFQPGWEGAGPIGHVAVVTGEFNNTFSVSEMDFPTPGAVTYRAALQVVAGVTFLYNPADMWKQLLQDDDFALSEVLKAHLLVASAYGHPNPAVTFPATAQDEQNEVAALRANGLAQFYTYLKNLEINNLPPGPA